jgi:DNA (cytosine-5)-methyltransferase 1
LGDKDDRALWPEYLRIVEESRPTWVVGENVVGLVSLALDNVLADLEGLGYAARAFDIPACAVGAWHQRRRIFIVAHDGRERVSRNEQEAISWVAALQGGKDGR